ncbi:uncharacterized protein N7458_003906 [Penicillium daleae]|uniref:Alginate lyase 2 domain-containing protein n=1 Tax=Penicillium daleae TaxID=63821 RepID=A0AAD6CBI6_9EURO|nr:uncharacterized protein N7458_003906 [Penicillium daleae]KAJ5455642.1 hypothetical protein N7458_003906 [Penicillium daleae]
MIIIPSTSRSIRLVYLLIAAGSNSVDTQEVWRLGLFLNPQCAPGGNFDLYAWELYLPVGSAGSPTTIFTSALEICSGYSNPGCFFTEAGDGAMVMKVPGSPSSSGCVTTPNTKYCRTELREENPSSRDPKAATNRLSATVSVPKPDNSNHGTVIGQIHMASSVSSYPVVKLYYNLNGDLTMGVHKSGLGGTEDYTSLGTISVGQKFSYEIQYGKVSLSVSINGRATEDVSLGNLDSPWSYFKTENHNQGDSPSEVHFFEVAVQH